MKRIKHRNGVECVHGKFLHEDCPNCGETEMSDLPICTGIVDKGPHDSNYGKNNCPDCRIAELEAEVHLAFYEGFESKRIDPDLAWDASNAKAALQEQEDE